ncbi:hypothetical protein IHF37_004577 [Salmonella enterica]|nr:hypothetical protein [Salmonella enterica]EAU0372920.1 hypothetical protein [Salmonella enterica]EGJ2553786.1 hypothetical protein [Salmonella enterica]
MGKQIVLIEVSENQHGGYSLLIGDESSGHRLCGAKVGGCETLESFSVNVSELINQVDVYSGSHYSSQPDLLSALQQLLEIYDDQSGRAWTTSSKRRALDNARAAVNKALGETK